jgi:pyridoxamine 5'-phosphate oxidase
VDLGDCFKFVKDNPTGFVATEEGGQPRVRPFTSWFADASGFYFHTSESKRVCKQLHKNPRIEVCFITHKKDLMMRILGSMEFLNEIALKTRLLEERPFLKNIVEGYEDTNLAVIRIPHGEAFFWTLADNLKEAEIPRIEF